MKSKIRDFLIVFAGIEVIITVATLYLSHAARAAVSVRPNLADVGFITATLSGHGIDWIYYRYTREAFILATTIAFIVAAVLAE